MSPPIYFRNLDSLRTVACFTVVFSHCLCVDYASFLGNGFLRHVFDLLVAGFWGVKLFFVLSGFLITYLLQQEITQSHQINLRNFYIRRIFRTFPLFYLSLFIGFIVYPYLCRQAGIESHLGYNPIYHLFFLGNFDKIAMRLAGLWHQQTLLINISWSVAIEEQFYIFLPLILYYSALRKYFTHIIGVFFFLSVIFKLSNHNEDVQMYHTWANIFYLSLGCLLATFSQNPRFISFFVSLNRFQIALIYIVGLTCLLYTPLFYPHIKIWHELVNSLFFCFVIAEQNFGTHSPLKYGDLSLLSRLGKYTYSAYLLHPIAKGIGTTTQKLLHIAQLNTFQSFYFTLAILGLTILFSYLSYHYFELPFLRLKKRFA
jgi:peptidoglycan/LPS O-acetylase OafA/YrhL